MIPSSWSTPYANRRDATAPLHQRRRTWGLTLGLCLALLVPAARAQITSALEGRVTDAQGAVIVGAEIRVTSSALVIDRQATSDINGAYRIAGLPPGVYSVTASKTGFATYRASDLEVTVNRTVTLDVILQVAAVTTEISVTGEAALVEPTSSSTASTITPRQIETMPLNGRDYLDLIQLVPGVAINRQESTVRSVRSQDPAGDAASPILGERGGNTLYLIDGMPNSDQVTGGAASQFNQESILEFQVITAGYRAEFGRGSGGVVNVVSKSGTNDWHGGVSFYHRNYKLDSPNIAGEDDPPFLLRWDPSFQLGGPIWKDRIFLFASAERIRESRDLNFKFPTGTPDILIAQETPLNLHNQIYDLRVRAKLDEQMGRHRLSQQVNWTNTQITDYLPLSQAFSLPSQRSNIDARHLMLGFGDTATLGNQSDPFLLDLFFQYRGEPSRTQAAHPAGGVADTLTNLFSSLDTGMLFGDLGQVEFGYGSTPTLLEQKYYSFGANLAKHWNRHEVKFGWAFQRMVVDGVESAFLFNQLFATQGDLAQFGPSAAGVYLLQTPAGLTGQDNIIALRNYYDGLYVQDDIKLLKNLTINVGLRWDYDSSFPNRGNVSPRIGVAWAVTPKTVVRGSWGFFYDHFRLGLARDIPAFGGANLVQRTFFSLPRLFYGNPTILLPLFAAIGYNTPCAASNLTDAQIGGAGCPFNPALPYFGIDHLNSVVASGNPPIPANTEVNINNVQALTGLTPDQFAQQAAAAIGQAPDYFVWDVLGYLGADKVVNAYNVPITLDPGFKTPYTSGFHVGVQQEITADLVIQADYFHKDIRDILGVRQTNLAFEARLFNNRQLVPGTGAVPIQGFGPWYAGKYDGLVISIRKLMSHHFTLEANYAWTDATDNVVTYTGTGTGYPSDAFVGVPPVVTEAGTTAGPCAIPADKSNANGPFVAANCNPVPQAGIFYNGPDLDKGPSSLALKHTFQVAGLVELPWKFEFSSIFRVQGGFPYSRATNAFIDIDGNTNTNGIDHDYGRNSFTAQTFTNMDIRVAKHFEVMERVKIHVYFEMFNLFNTDNPAAVQTLPGQPDPFGSKLQVLPGREGQIGLRIEF